MLLLNLGVCLFLRPGKQRNTIGISEVVIICFVNLLAKSWKISTFLLQFYIRGQVFSHLLAPFFPISDSNENICNGNYQYYEKKNKNFFFKFNLKFKNECKYKYKIKRKILF